jgi:eukaryotic-like serine/threonine-protein kinase
VVHRDLKPGNVKIRPDGVVKVLDFGLAKAGGPRSAAQSDDSPTMTTPRTEAGMIVGTAAYMAPEQVKGREVDKRADIWAFGCVFYEMLTGRSLYQGDTSQETMASILRDEPDLTTVPDRARHLLRRCLEKDPQKRLRHIGDVMSLLDVPASGQYPATSASTATTRLVSRKWLWVGVAAAIVITAGAALVVWATWRPRTTTLQAVRFEVAPTERMTFNVGANMAVSPDGHWMVFPATRDGVTGYWVRSLDTVEARALPGTETVAFAPPAAWSFDSRYVIFTSNNKLKKVDIHGGPPQTLGDLPTFQNGVTGNKDGVLVLGLSNVGGGGPLLRVPAAGGTATPATVLAKGDTRHQWPQFLPDGRHFIYLRVSNDPNQMGVYVGSIDVKPDAQSLERLLASDRQAYYAASTDGGAGHLIFLRETTLLAQPFDPSKLELSGEPVPIAEGVDSFAGANYGLFSVSDTGTLAYRSSTSTTLTLAWFDRNGNPAATLGEPGDYSNPAVSPDGTRVAVAIGFAGLRDIWILDIARGARTRFTFDPADDNSPVWSPDGKNIVFSSNRKRQFQLFIKPADGSGEEQLLGDSSGQPTSWSKDGRCLLFSRFTGAGSLSLIGGGGGIWALPNPGRLSGEGQAFLIVPTQSSLSIGQAQFSPDGRWVAYTSLESANSEIYVRPFSRVASDGGGGAKWLISTGAYPRWRSDGKELFYTAGPQVMAVDIDTSRGFRAGAPRRLFTAPPTFLAGWDLAPDGKRFLFLTAPSGTRAEPFTVVLNWAAALKK